MKFLLVLGFFFSTSSFAGIFDLPGFLEPGHLSVGLEPEVIISNGSGAGINIKPKYGVNNLINVEGIVGMGTGARTFRMGGIADFEFFPDVDNQPGLAAAANLIYYNFADAWLMQVGATPMIYKTFKGEGGFYTPFFGIPLGWNLRETGVTPFAQAALGGMFKLPQAEQFRFALEGGFNITGAYSYISGGVTYYH